MKQNPIYNFCFFFASYINISACFLQFFFFYNKQTKQNKYKYNSNNIDNRQKKYFL